MYNRFSTLLVVAAITVQTATADDATIARLRADVGFLAGPECEGRGVTTPGIRKAADHIAREFRLAGLRPAGPNGSYFQPFTISGQPKLGTPNTLALIGPDGTATDLKYGTDFVPTGLTASGKVSAGLVFAGYGITATEPAYDDYAGLDVAGKVVVILRQGPRAAGKEPPFDANKRDQHVSLKQKLTNAVKQGATGVLFVNNRVDAKSDALMEFGYAAGPDDGVPVFHVKRDVADRLLSSQGKTLEEVEDAIDEGLKPHSLALTGWKLNGEAAVTRPDIPAMNVLAVAEGSGPLAGETVVIGAHYDHLGRGEFGSLGGKDAKGQIHHGADDNASGVAALLELARRYGARDSRVGRRIIFAAFSGEEIGLLGSKHYCEHPPFPLGSTAFMLNMDMVGRSALVEKAGLASVVGVSATAAGPDGWTITQRLVINGVGTADGLEQLVSRAADGRGFKLLTRPGGTGPSDHDTFYRKKIPVLFLYTGSHRDYHRPSDTADKIDYPGLMQITDLAGDLGERLATTPDRPKYIAVREVWDDPTDPAPRRSGRAGAPRLGVMPGNYDATDGGVLVDDLSPGGAAEKGGIRPGDVIVEIAGQPVKNIGGYMAAMAGRKPGEEIEVVVVRGDQRVPLKVTPTP